MRTWYTNIMPLWRGKSGSISWPLARTKGPDDDWQQVMRGGANSLQVVVIVLYWWMLKARMLKPKASGDAALAEAGSMCEDLVYVLSDMHKDTIAPDLPVVVSLSP